MVTDLTLISATIPSVPKREISRDNLTSLIRDLFSTDRRTIVVQGSDGAGKTTLLSQFARAHPECSFSFFIGTTLLTSSPRYYLLDLCEQMGLVLERDTDHLEQLDEEELKQIYHDFIRRIALLSKKTGQ